eukprot:jgi/Chlat1/9113/Chrsp97S09276
MAIINGPVLMAERHQQQQLRQHAPPRLVEAVTQTEAEPEPVISSLGNAFEVLEWGAKPWTWDSHAMLASPAPMHKSAHTDQAVTSGTLGGQLVQPICKHTAWVQDHGVSMYLPPMDYAEHGHETEEAHDDTDSTTDFPPVDVASNVHLFWNATAMDPATPVVGDGMQPMSDFPVNAQASRSIQEGAVSLAAGSAPAGEPAAPSQSTATAGGPSDVAPPERTMSGPASSHTGEDSVAHAPAAKRSRGGGAARAPMECQVDGCGVGLASEKEYYKRHRVCPQHAKGDAVLSGGFLQRFCQQCSRFQPLVDFDADKRSCRMRLKGHNRRRRKTREGSEEPEPKAQGAASAATTAGPGDAAATAATASPGVPVPALSMQQMQMLLLAGVGGGAAVPRLPVVLDLMPQDRVLSGTQAAASATLNQALLSTQAQLLSTLAQAQVNAAMQGAMSGSLMAGSHNTGAAAILPALLEAQRILIDGGQRAQFLSQVLDWLSGFPFTVDSYIRPGCVLLTLEAIMPRTQWQQLKKDMTSTVKKLLNGRGKSFWKEPRSRLNLQIEEMVAVVFGVSIAWV